MNYEVNESTQVALMKIVERAVRPLRAGRIRKLSMREELLGHLVALFNEELAHRADEPAALSRASERFGNPRELSRELAGSLTWRDHATWANERCVAVLDRTFGWLPGEPFARFACRSAGAIAALNLLLFLFIFVVARVRPDSFDPTFASFNRFTFALFAGMAAYEIALVWCIPVTHNTLYGGNGSRRWLATAVSLAAWTALWVCLAGAFWFGITLSLEAVLQQLPRIAFFAALTLPPIVLLMAWATANERKRYEPYARWWRLVLDD